QGPQTSARCGRHDRRAGRRMAEGHHRCDAGELHRGGQPKTRGPGGTDLRPVHHRQVHELGNHRGCTGKPGRGGPTASQERLLTPARRGGRAALPTPCPRAPTHPRGPGASGGHRPPVLCFRMSLTVLPPWTTRTTLSGSPSREMSVSGSPSHTTRSACLPGSRVPILSACPNRSAASRVPASSAFSGLRPCSTRSASSRRFWPWSEIPESVPRATLAPARMAAVMFSLRCSWSLRFLASAYPASLVGSGGVVAVTRVGTRERLV